MAHCALQRLSLLHCPSKPQNQISSFTQPSSPLSHPWIRQRGFPGSIPSGVSLHCSSESRRLGLQAAPIQAQSSLVDIDYTEMGAVEDASSKRYAVVTGSNKGIGLETVRQLALQGVTVVLTARNEKRGLEATSSLHGSGLSNVIFHQLDVLDPNSIESLAEFVLTKFERLDILVNNAGASGVIVDEDALRAMTIDPASWLSGKATNLVQGVIKTTYEKARECVDTNYYGCKRVTEALLPCLLRSPTGAKIVNVSSLRSELRRVPSEEKRSILADIDTLTEDKLDNLLQSFLNDLKDDALEANGWCIMLPAYSISKVTLNAYTRLLAKKYPSMYVNCVHPGFVDTDINWHTGTMTLEEGARGSVMLSLLPEGGPSGCYFDQTTVAEF
uniref:Uncharacterized protein n=2 Tax=Kalanchoe fedtschenkoi TaxID=63787 RepID=A0A7N0RIH1_KALFE